MRPSDFEAAFRAAFERVYMERPERMPARWTVKELSMVKNAVLSKWSLDRLAARDTNVLHFADWIVTEWDYLRHHVFSFMTRWPPPAEPEIGFICRRHSVLLSAFNGNERDKWIANIDNYEERRLRELMMKHGKSREEALMILAEERARQKMRDENRKAKQEANDAWQKAQIARKEAERLKLAKGYVHPESQTALQQRAEKLREELGVRPLASDEPLPDLMSCMRDFEE